MTRLLAAAFAASLLALPAIPAALAQTPPTPSAAQPGPDDRAKQWLTLVDDGNYADSVRQMGPQAKKAAAAALPALRAPLGAVSNRNLKDVTLTRTRPGMPAGQYAVVRYDSNFAHKNGAVETVTLALTKGAWAVVGYRID
jgi:hypothetical protein